MTSVHETEVAKRPEQKEEQQFVWNITEYESQAPRITGIQKLRSCGLLTPSPMFVLGHAAFEEYQKSGITPAVRTQVLEAFQEIRQTGRGAYIGRAYFVPKVEAPAGPRTAAIYEGESYVAEAESFYQFALENKYNIPGADIALVLHPFIHPAQPPMKEEPFVQWPGGAVTPLPNGQTLIQAIYGPDEAIQGYDSDEYLVRLRRDGISINWKIANKAKTLRPYKSEYIETSIHRLYQDEQVLSVPQIFEIAQGHQKINNLFGPHRLEWIVQEEGIVFRECAPFDVKPEDFFFLEGELTQPTIVIASESDIARVTPPSAIIHYPAELYQDRRIVPLSILLASQAKRENINLVVLTHGSIATQHMVRRHQDFNQSVLFTGDDKLEEGQIIRVFRSEDGTPRWKRVEKESNNIIDLRDARRMSEAAPKARNLSILAEHGVPVPKAFYLTENTFKQYLTFLGLDQAVKKLNNLSGETLRKKSEAIQTVILESKFPDSLREQVERKLEEFLGENFSVRSAENHEDEATALAGLFKSHIGVTREVIPKKILECWASGFSYHTIEYVKASGISPSEIKMGVLIQEMIEGKGGVMYTGKKIDILAGKSPETITSGTEKKPHHLETTREGEVLEEEIHPEVQILNQEEVEKIVNLALKIEAIFGEPQDIEWIIDQEGKIWILQSRPLA